MVLSTNFKKVFAKVEGILLLISNVALVVVSAATNALSPGQAVKWGVALNGTAYVASEIRSALENKSIIQLLGMGPTPPLSDANQKQLEAVTSEGAAGIVHAVENMQDIVHTKPAPNDLIAGDQSAHQ